MSPWNNYQSSIVTLQITEERYRLLSSPVTVRLYVLTFFSGPFQRDSGALFWRFSSLAHPATVPMPRQPPPCPPLCSAVLHSQWCRSYAPGSSVTAASRSPPSLLHQWWQCCYFMDLSCVYKHFPAQPRSGYFYRLGKWTVPGNQRQGWVGVHALATAVKWLQSSWFQEKEMCSLTVLKTQNV